MFKFKPGETQTNVHHLYVYLFFVLFIKDHFTARNNSQVFYCRSLALAYIQVLYQSLYSSIQE